MALFDAPLWFRFLSGLLVGLALGSFATMLAYRVPRRLSIVKPPSHCPHCSTPLTPRDLVPIVSYIREKGRCRHCHKRIGIRYPLIEGFTALATLVAFVQIGFQPALIAALVAIIAFVTLATVALMRE